MIRRFESSFVEFIHYIILQVKHQVDKSNMLLIGIIIFATFYNSIVIIKNYKELVAFIREEDKG